jgi:hypothetical protein
MGNWEITVGNLKLMWKMIWEIGKFQCYIFPLENPNSPLNV